MCFDLALDRIHAESTESLTHRQSSSRHADRSVRATRHTESKAAGEGARATRACHTGGVLTCQRLLLQQLARLYGTCSANPHWDCRLVV